MSHGGEHSHQGKDIYKGRRSGEKAPSPPPLVESRPLAMNFKSLNRNAPQRPQPIRPPQRVNAFQPPRPTSGLALPPINASNLPQGAPVPPQPVVNSLVLPPIASSNDAVAATAPAAAPTAVDSQPPQSQQQAQVAPGQEMSLEQQYITNVEGIVPTLQ